MPIPSEAFAAIPDTERCLVWCGDRGADSVFQKVWNFIKRRNTTRFSKADVQGAGHNPAVLFETGQIRPAAGTERHNFELIDAGLIVE